MSEYIAPLARLIEQFRRLSGIGQKTAQRLAFCVLDFSDEEASAFAEAILDAKRSIVRCSVCGNYAADTLCSICADDTRDRATVCVVEDARTVMAIEKVRNFRGLYHVLGGALSPMNGVGPDKLRIAELVERVATGGVQEVILATNPTVEGEATALYIARLLAPYGVKTTRLAYGVPVGGELEYADEVTLHRALEGRQNIGQQP